MNFKQSRSFVVSFLVMVALFFIGVISLVLSYKMKNFIYIVLPLFFGIISTVITINSLERFELEWGRKAKTYCLVSFAFSFSVVVLSLLYLFQSIAYYSAYGAMDIYVG